MKKINIILTSILFLLLNNLISQCKPSLYLPFNGNAKDSSGNNNHGTINGATLTSDRFNNPNRAYYFDGVNDDITITDDSTNDLTKTYTITAWIKPATGYGSFQDNHVCVVDKWGNAGNKLAAYNMSIHTNGELEGFTHTGTNGTYKWSNSIIPVNKWTHIAVTRGTDDSIRLYINGILDKTYYSVLPQNSNFPLKIGMQADPSINSAYPSKYRFKGSIDEVKLFKCALKPKDFDIGYPKLEIVSIVSNNVSSAGLSDGNFRVFVKGGYSPYSYSIDSFNYQDTNFFANLNSGTKRIFIKDFNGTSIDTFVIISEPTNISFMDYESNQIEVYPNPNSGKFIIKNIETSDYNVLLFDSNGKNILTKQNDNIIDIELNSGIYQLLIKDNINNKYHFRKIVIN